MVALGAFAAMMAIPFLMMLVEPRPVSAAVSMGLMWILPFVAFHAVLSLLRETRAQQRASRRAVVECPRCGRTLRDDGPASWNDCTDAEMACAACGTAVTEESYAAATLPSPWESVCRDNLASPRLVFVAAVVLAPFVALAAFSLTRMFGITIDTSPSETDTILRETRVLARVLPLVGVATIAVLFSLPLTHLRRLRARFRRWGEHPVCLRCGVDLPMGVDAAITVCRSCDERYSTAQLVIDAADGASRPIWPSMRGVEPTR